MAQVRTYYFEDGNAARQLVEATPEEQFQREERRRQEVEKRRRAKARKQAAAMRRNRIYTMYLVTAVGVLCGLFVGYVNLQNNITTSMSNISSLESEISQLKADNSATASRINTATNLNDVKATAINDLGMVYAGADQIVYYNMESTDYMSQYNDIP